MVKYSHWQCDIPGINPCYVLTLDYAIFIKNKYLFHTHTQRLHWNYYLSAYADGRNIKVNFTEEIELISLNFVAQVSCRCGSSRTVIFWDWSTNTSPGSTIIWPAPWGWWSGLCWLGWLLRDVLLVLCLEWTERSLQRAPSCSWFRYLPKLLKFSVLPAFYKLRISLFQWIWNSLLLPPPSLAGHQPPPPHTTSRIHRQFHDPTTSVGPPPQLLPPTTSIASLHDQFHQPPPPSQITVTIISTITSKNNSLSRWLHISVGSFLFWI